MLAGRITEQVDQRIKRREAADFSLVLVFSDLVKKPRRVERRKTLDQFVVFAFDPLEEIFSNGLPIAEFPAYVRQVDSGDKTDTARFLLCDIA
jgi:hypothetical protein